MSSLVLWTLVACEPGLTGYTEPPPPSTTASQTVPEEEPTVPEVRYASDVKIEKISIYQGVESILVEDGEPPSGLQAPVVAGRDALLRVFLRPTDAFEPRRLEAVLTIVNNQEVVYTGRNRIEERSTDADLESTLNIDISGADIKEGSELVVEILEVDDDFPGGGSKEDVKWRSLAQDGLGAEASDDLTIVIVPIRYDADGSGRLPDTSDAQIQRIKDEVTGIYPAKSVTIRVDPAVSWSQPVNPLNDRQWGDLLTAVNQLRDSANEPSPNTYYYGMFNGAVSINEYCRFGCILGLSLLAYTANDPYFRASIGVGFTGQESAETLVHEVGHAHGRDHAPCGTSGDRNYPYPGASIGSWGYDIVDGRLFDPDVYVDMMSYCAPVWVSDYNYSEILDRIQSVKLMPRAARTSREAVAVASDGSAVRAGRMNVSAGSGLPIALDLYDADGRYAGVGAGQYFPYSDIDGGVVALDQDLPDGWTAVAPALPER